MSMDLKWLDDAISGLDGMAFDYESFSTGVTQGIADLSSLAQSKRVTAALDTLAAVAQAFRDGATSAAHLAGCMRELKVALQTWIRNAPTDAEIAAARSNVGVYVRELYRTDDEDAKAEVQKKLDAARATVTDLEARRKAADEALKKESERITAKISGGQIGAGETDGGMPAGTDDRMLRGVDTRPTEDRMLRNVDTRPSVGAPSTAPATVAPPATSPGVAAPSASPMPNMPVVPTNAQAQPQPAVTAPPTAAPASTRSTQQQEPKSLDTLLDTMRETPTPAAPAAFISPSPAAPGPAPAAAPSPGQTAYNVRTDADVTGRPAPATYLTGAMATNERTENHPSQRAGMGTGVPMMPPGMMGQPHSAAGTPGLKSDKPKIGRYTTLEKMISDGDSVIIGATICQRRDRPRREAA